MANEQKLADMYVDVKIKTEKLEKDLQGLKNKSLNTAKEMGNGFSGLTGTLAKVGIGALGVSTAFSFIKNSIKEAQDAQIAFKQVEQAVRQTGGAAGFTAKQLKSIADNLESATATDADTIMKDVSLQLLTFGKIQGDVFKRAQTAALDLSAVLGSDLKSQTIQLGKALEDPIKGITALSRAGVTFTQEQKDNIALLIKQNDLFGAQTIILDEINSKYGGQAEALANASGGTKKLVIAMNNLLETVGTPIVSFLNSFVDSVMPIKNIATEADNARESSAILSEEFDRLSNRVLTLGNKTNRTTEETKIYEGAILKLQSKFPNYFKDMDLNKLKYEDIETAISNARIELDNYIDSVIEAAVMKDFESEVGKIGAELTKFKMTSIDAKKALDILNKTGVQPTKFKDSGMTTEEARTKLKQQIGWLDLGIKDYENKLKDVRNRIDDAQDILKKDKDVIPPNNEIGNDDGNDDKTDKVKVQKQLNIAEQIRANNLQELEDIKILNKALEDKNLPLMERIKLENNLNSILKKRSDEYPDTNPLTKKPEISPIPEMQPVNQPENPVKFTDEETKKNLELIMESGAEFENKMVNAFYAVQDIAYILNVGVDTFVGKLLSGLNDAVSLANSIISIIGLFANVGSGGIFSVLGGLFGHDGGTFQDGKKVKSFAQGGSLIVPPGYPNDSYPLLVESGERVTVTPSDAVAAQGMDSKLLKELIGSIKAASKNSLNKQTNPNIIIKIDSRTITKEIYSTINKLKNDGYNLDYL